MAFAVSERVVGVLVYRDSQNPYQQATRLDLATKLYLTGFDNASYAVLFLIVLYEL